MGNRNKIEKHNLVQEVLTLAEQGLTQRDIVTQLKYRHSDIKDLDDLSSMSVNRFLKSHKIKDFQNQMNEGRNPEEELLVEFRDKMYDLDDETHILLKESKALIRETKSILKSVKKQENINLQLNAIKNSVGALKQVGNTIEQIRRNWNTFVEQGYHDFVPIKDAKQVNFIQINNMLLELSNSLCSNCRKKIVDLITIKEEH